MTVLPQKPVERTRILIWLCMAAGVIAGLFFVVVRPALGPDPNPVRVEIPRGAGAAQIARLLRDRGVLRSPKAFLLLARLSGSEPFKQGTYLLERNHYRKALDMIRRGLTLRVKVTVPEGWSAWQVAERLEAEGVIADKRAFYSHARQNGLEGRLFPETYFFELGLSEAAVAAQMEALFRERWTPEFSKRAAELRLKDGQALTLASIIEREAQMGQERALISSVYHNRLRRRMRLDADPTVQYALAEGRFWKERIIFADLRTPSPYNTYKVYGLPPGPICNPGLESIKAALYPEKTDYLFFVADGKGGHVFSTNSRDHSRAVAERNKVRAAQADPRR